MTSMLKAEDQILYVPPGVNRRGRTAQQLAEEEATTEEGFVTSVRHQTAFCRFYHTGGRLRTVANSEACNLADLMPLTRAGRGDFFVLVEALKAFAEPDEEDAVAGTTHRLDTSALTVFAVDRFGEEHDLNAEGAPCNSLTDLRDFVDQLYGQGLEVSALLVEIDAEMRQGWARDETRSS